MSTEHVESPLPELKVPTFESKVPEYLISGANDQDKWLVSQMSVNTQMTEWMLKTLAETHSYVRNTNGRTRKNEDSIRDLEKVVAMNRERLDKTTPYIEGLQRFTSFLAHRWVWVSIILLGASLIFTIYYLFSHAGAGTVIGDLLKAISG